ncbi:right-handed parallel beta-helix repeat-containing protein [Puniceicoccales bacterium CK1056]|uniref:Right-handed parallel beta-helix repeat-containing protein n=1 Tax=Oceanipulchritudo coccoides TaxID=2706888 RepID=A0A6B2M052_9BACT|nr:right-handed parallel beta-helix repeat-containing protein [Oceanipulchritudo coccoides]NDV61554.1 right-handed parallel beta-helix repeat-containing protein [Oceanipulchritudo coccoides]
MMYRILTFIVSIAAAELGAQTVVASYGSDFNTTGAPTAGWSYLWNAPDGWGIGVTGDQASGFIGAPASYVPLILASPSYTADGDLVGGNNPPSGFMRLSSGGGHPGVSVGGSNMRDRYAIAAYTVPSSGHYAIANSFITMSNSSSNGVEVLVFPGISEAVLRHVSDPFSTTSFDTEIGYLDAGQTIYVAFGPNGSATSDSFSMDFDIVRTDRLSFRDQFLNGLASGADVITITPGRYYANPSSTYVYRGNFNPPTPVTVIADGVELINQSDNRTISLVNCNNLTLRGLSIDYDPQLYRQGTVESRNYSTGTFELRLHEGYPQTLSTTATSGITYEPSNLTMKQMTNTIYPNGNVTEIEPGLYQVNANFSNMDVGDFVSLTVSAGIPHGIYLENCTGVRLEDIEIHGAPAFAVLSVNGFQISLENVQITPGATPLRASIPRLLSSNADGLHFKHSYGEININNSHTAYTGDDGIILTTAYAPILEKNAANAITVATKSSSETVEVGDELYIYDPVAGTRESAIIQTVSPVAMSETAIRAEISILFPDANLTNSTFEQAFLLTLDTNVTTGTGGIVANRSGDSSGSVISNCTIDNTRARGILIKASNVVVRNNSVYNSFLPGIQVRPDAFYWMEGDFAHNVIIEDNELTRCSIARSNGYTPIYVSARGFNNWTPGTGHSNLTIRRNKITTPASGGILIEYADDVKLRSNTTTNSHNFTSASPFYDSVIRLERVNNVSIYGVNLVSGINEANANMSALIDTGPQVTNLNVVAGLLLDQDTDQLPDDWEIDNFGFTSVVDANDDTDGDGLTEAEEFIAVLNPLQQDFFQAKIGMSGGLHLNWTPKANRFVTVYQNETLDTSFSILEQDIPAEDGTFDLPPLVEGSIFYRIAITE